MKSKIDLNQRTHRMSILWRTVLGAIILCLLTSLSSYGQGSFLTLNELKKLQTKINDLENILAFPKIASDPIASADIALQIQLLQAILDHSVLGLNLNNPQPGDIAGFNAAQEWLAWQQQQEADQVTQQEQQSETLLAQDQNSKELILLQLQQSGALDPVPAAVAPIAPPGSYSYDPAK